MSKPRPKFFKATARGVTKVDKSLTRTFTHAVISTYDDVTFWGTWSSRIDLAEKVAADARRSRPAHRPVKWADVVVAEEITEAEYLVLKAAKMAA